MVNPTQYRKELDLIFPWFPRRVTGLLFSGSLMWGDVDSLEFIAFPSTSHYLSSLNIIYRIQKTFTPLITEVDSPRIGNYYTL